MNLNNYIPLLTTNFLNHFNKSYLKDKICLEIGSGDSTIYWSKYFKKIISYEHDVLFFNKIKKETNKISNIKIFKFKKNIFNSSTFKKHIHIADVIIIDNDPKFIDRKNFCIFAKENKKEESIIVLDNGTWNKEAYQYMFDNFFCLDFPGKNKYNELTVTSIFFKQKTKEYINYTILKNETK